MTAPLASVVIPSCDRRDALRRTLDALRTQTAPPASFEVIVAVDGRGDGTVEMLAGYAAPYALRAVRCDAGGAAGARNLGAAAARGRILVFLDDDVVPGPALIAEHLRQHGEAPGRVVVGAFPPAARPGAGYYRARVERWWAAEFERLRRPGHRFTHRDLLTGNVSLEREALERLGGFDAAFRTGREDWELGARLLDAGLEFVYAPAAHAVHDMVTDVPHSFRRARAEGRADVLLAARHPRLRGSLDLRPRAGPARPVDLLLRGLARRRPAAGDRLADALAAGLPALERLRLEPAWAALFGALRRYWYWRGAEEEGAPDPLAAAAVPAGRGRGRNETPVRPA